MLQFRDFWLVLAWLCFITIVVFSLISIPNNMVISIPYIDKAEHFGSYFVLMLLFAQCYREKNIRFIYACVFISVGILLEVLQSFTVTRLFEYADMLANTSGVLLAWKMSDGYLHNGIIFIDSFFKRCSGN